MSIIDLYAAKQIREELKVLETFHPLLIPEAIDAFLAGKTDWISYHPTLLEIIVELNAKMPIVYSRHVMEAAKLLDMDGPGLETLVYNSQRYWDAENTLARFKAHLETIQAEGFCLLSASLAEKLRVTNAFVEVYLMPTQRIRARLTYTQANGYCWMMPRYRTRGYPAFIEQQYVKISGAAGKSDKGHAKEVSPRYETSASEVPRSG